MLFFKVPVQLSKEEGANAKNSKKLVSAHYEGKKKKEKKNPKPPNTCKARISDQQDERDSNFM